MSPIPAAVVGATNPLCHGRTSSCLTQSPCGDGEWEKSDAKTTEQRARKSVVNQVGAGRCGKELLIIACDRTCSPCLALTEIHCHTHHFAIFRVPESNWWVCFNNVQINVYQRLTWMYYSIFTLLSPLINASCCELHLPLLSTILHLNKQPNILSIEHIHSKVEKRLIFILADHLHRCMFDLLI